MREYLLHYGYASTLAAFDTAAGTTEDASQPGASRFITATAIQSPSSCHTTFAL